MTDKKTPRVAVIGASGIGRHHANWWRLEGAAVTAFVGTTPESVAKTASMLQETFGITARGYTQMDEMLKTEQPDIVDVCSPPPCHAEHVRAALEANCHVLCEKPFVYDPTLDSPTLLRIARELVSMADQRALRLGICTQYSAGAPVMKSLLDPMTGSAPIAEYCGHLESPAKGRSPDPVRVWVDLSPHPLSVLLQLFPDIEVDWDSLQTRFEGYVAEARFSARHANGAVDCSIITRNALEPPLNVRSFTFNEYTFRIEGERDEQGIYRARIECGERAWPCDDFMRLLIRHFLEGNVVTTGAEGLRNLEIMLRIIDVWRASTT